MCTGTVFINHIQDHPHPGAKVVYKICDQTAEYICRTESKENFPQGADLMAWQVFVALTADPAHESNGHTYLAQMAFARVDAFRAEKLRRLAEKEGENVS